MKTQHLPLCCLTLITIAYTSLFVMNDKNPLPLEPEQAGHVAGWLWVW